MYQLKLNVDFIIIILENKIMENLIMRKIEDVLNKLLVQLFNDILQIEEKSLKNTQFTDLSITEIHTIEAIGLDKSNEKIPIIDFASITYLPDTKSKS